MKDTFSVVLVGLTVVALVFSTLAFLRPASVERVVDRVTERKVAGSSGPEHYNHQLFYAGFTKGGTVVATSSTAATYTLTTDEIREDVSLLSWTPNVNTTLTTMASTSAPLSNLAAGEELSLNIYNASSTAASTITLAAGTGVDLQEDEGETVIINGSEVARLTFFKKADSDVVAWLEVGQVGD